MAKEGNGHESKDEIRVGSPVSLRDKIFAAEDSRSELVLVEEWDVELEVRSMSGKARAEAMAQYMDRDTGRLDFEALTPELLIRSCYKPGTDEWVFKPGDRDKLNAKSSGPLERLGQIALRLSGLDQRARDAAGKD